MSLRTVHLVINALEEKATWKSGAAAITPDETRRTPGPLGPELPAGGPPPTDVLHLRPGSRGAGSPADRPRGRPQGVRAPSRCTAGPPSSRRSFAQPDVHAYFRGDLDRLVTTLDLRPVEAGGTIHLLEPYDPGVFYRLQTVRKIQVGLQHPALSRPDQLSGAGPGAGRGTSPPEVQILSHAPAANRSGLPGWDHHGFPRGARRDHRRPSAPIGTPWCSSVGGHRICPRAIRQGRGIRQGRLFFQCVQRWVRACRFYRH